MVDINKLVNKYSAPKIDNLQALFEVISHVAEVDLIEREMLPKKTTDEETDTLTLSYLPEIGVSELGWASLQTGDGEAVPRDCALTRGQQTAVLPLTQASIKNHSPIAVNQSFAL